MSTTLQDLTDEDPHVATGYASSSSPSVLVQSPPSICPIQRGRTPSDTSGVTDEMRVPRRFPRRTAAEKAIQDDLIMVAGIGSDLDNLDKIAALEPTLELYYQLRAGLDAVGKATRLLRRQDPRVQKSRDELHARHALVHKTLTAWASVVGLPDTPRVVDTSKLCCSLPDTNV